MKNKSAIEPQSSARGEPCQDSTKAPLITEIGLLEGEVLLELEKQKPLAVKELPKKVNSPLSYVTMAVGALIRKGLVKVRRRHQDEVFLELKSRSTVSVSN